MNVRRWIGVGLAAGMAAGLAITQRPATSQLLPQLPGTVVNTMDLMKAEWKYQPCTMLDADGQIGYTWPKGAHKPDFNDSGWKTIDHLPTGQGAAEVMQPGVSCGWFRKTIELPARMGDADLSSSRPFLIYCVDDYQETWIDGKRNISGRYPNMFCPWEIRGFNKPTVIDLSAAPYNLKPGQSFKLAIQGFNGPTAEPYGGYWFREARIEFRR